MRSTTDESPASPARAPSRLAGLCAGAVTACAFLFLFLPMLSMGLRRGVNHDESQHLAAGAVFGRHLLLPYRDFPYFHMPDLVFVYGALFRWGGPMLLAARMLSVEAGWLTCVLLWYIVWRECRGKAWPARWLLPAASVLLLLGNPLFREGYWRTWNHALATLFGLVAVALAMRASARIGRWFSAGIFIGLAIGTRLTFAPLFAPLAVAAAWEPARGTLRQRLRGVWMLCAGAALSLLPALVLFAIAPAQFIFGNFTFNSTVNILFRQSYHDPRITWHAKLLYPFVTLLPNAGNWLPALLFVLFAGAALARVFKMLPDLRYRLLLVLALIPFTLIGAVAPSPSQTEYYYALVPLLVLAAALSAAYFSSGRWGWICPVLLLLPGIYCTARSWDEYQRIAILKDPAAWPPILLHQAGVEAAQSIREGRRVLTLEPIFPLEGGLDIYPSLVTGNIAWRTEPFIAPGDRARLQILGLDNLDAAMEESPPAAVLTISPSALDGPLAAWARRHGYAPHFLQARGKLVDQPIVWTRP